MKQLLENEERMIYIASPYSHPDRSVMELRYRYVMNYVDYLLKKGEFAYSPIVYGHEIAKYHSLPTDANFWKNWDEAMMRRCDVLHFYLLDGWKESNGMMMELNYAEENGMPIVYVEPSKTGGFDV